MSVDRPKSLRDLLHSGHLEALGEEARRRRELTDEVRRLLDDDEAAHLISASDDTPGQLVLTMDSAVWAARVRCRGGELAGRRVKVKVAPRPA